MVKPPRWLFVLMALLVGIGIVTSFARNPVSNLIPVAIIVSVFLIYRFGLNKKSKIKKSSRTEAKLKAARTAQMKKRIRPRSKAKLTVIEGSKGKNESRQQSK